MATAEDLAEMDLRLYRLELQLLGVNLSTSKQTETFTDERSSTTTDNKSSTRHTPRTPIKSTSIRLFHGHEEGTEEDAILDTQPLTKLTEIQNDFVTRLTALELMVAASSSSPHRDAFEQTYKEIEAYLQDLDPGVALTHQQQIAAPLMYRRQEVLASANELKRNFEYVSEILNLLLIGQTQVPIQKSTDLISEMHVTKAPILVQTTGPFLSRKEQDQLAQIQTTLQDLRQRVETAAVQVDRMLRAYQKLVMSISEKLVLFDEEIRLQQKIKKDVK